MGSNTIGKFTFRIMKMDKKVKLPFNPIVTITLDNWTASKDEAPTISLI